MSAPAPTPPTASSPARARAAARAARAARAAARLRWARTVALLRRLGLDEDAVTLTFAIVVGVGASLGVVAFYRAVDLSAQAFLAWPARAFPSLPVAALRPAVTALALTLAWALWRRVGRGDDGYTVPDVQRVVAAPAPRLPFRRTLARTAASALTVGGGGSAGAEGPVAVLGAGVGARLARLFDLPRERARVLVGAGTAAGISAAFNAPLAGAFFALEEILGTLRTTTFAPVVVASVVGAVVSRAVFGDHPAFPIPREYGYTHPVEVVLLFPLLGVVCGLVTALFVRVHFGVGALAARVARRLERAGPSAWRGALLPAGAGLLVGVLVLASGGLLVGSGHVAIPLVAFGRMTWWALLALALGKIVVTAVTLQGGGSGGLFTPALFVGAATGGMVGVLLRSLLGGLAIAPEAYAIVGMGAVVAAATGAPITAVILVFELTGDYALVPPLMVAVVLCHIVARRLEPDTLYSGWLRRKGVGPVHDDDAADDAAGRDAPPHHVRPGGPGHAP